jgi:hypothetical protein
VRRGSLHKPRGFPTPLPRRRNKMEILREENGNLITPYSKEQFDAIYKSLIVGFNTETKCIDNTNIDIVYEDLVKNAEKHRYWGTEWEKFTAMIPADDIKQFILSYAKVNVSIDLRRTIDVIETGSIDSNDFPDDLDLSDMDAVQKFVDECEEDGEIFLDESDRYEDEITSNVTYSLNFPDTHPSRKDTFIYENIVSMKEVA